MNFAGMNILAIAVAAVAGFAFGSVYYMALSARWLEAVEKTREQLMPSGKPKPGPFIVSAVALVVMAWVLAGTLGHLGPGQVTLKNGIISALFIWVGFVATTLAVNNGYAGRRISLTVIDGLHWLGVLVIQGAIIGAFGV
ncbi:MAG: DUF1761 domain-containing protein [Alphaproteobacteria bacterium]|nr:DUF1761 domain-containing protein [Alphaproteobacteria bacterium]